MEKTDTGGAATGATPIQAAIDGKTTAEARPKKNLVRGAGGKFTAKAGTDTAGGTETVTVSVGGIPKSWLWIGGGVLALGLVLWASSAPRPRPPVKVAGTDLDDDGKPVREPSYWDRGRA